MNSSVDWQMYLFASSSLTVFVTCRDGIQMVEKMLFCRSLKFSVNTFGEHQHPGISGNFPRELSLSMAVLRERICNMSVSL